MTGLGLKPTVQGKINGNMAPMLIDTGAYRSFLTARYVQKLDIPTRLTGMTANGIGGAQDVRAARVKEFSVGPSRPVQGHFPVMGEYANETPYAMILGADFLQQADLLFDLTQGFMQFFYPSNCKKETLIFPDATVLDADWLDYDTRMHVTLKVNGVPMRTLIDTGASVSMIDRDAAKRAGITPEMPKARPKSTTSGVGRAEIAAWFVPIAKLEIGKDTYSDLMLEMADIAGSSYENRSDIILGTDFLSSHRVLFARSQQKVYLIKQGPLKLVGSEADWAAIYEAHAAKGHPAAMSYLAELLYAGKGVAPDDARAAKLLKDAAALGDQDALLRLAYDDFALGNFAKAATSLRNLSAEPGASRRSDLMSFLASAHNGELALATQELQAVRKRAIGKHWPMPVVDFLLNDSDETDLLAAARKQPLSAKSRECEAHFVIGHVSWLGGKTAAARRAFDTVLATCKSNQFEYRASAAALKQLEALAAVPASGGQ